ncbi:MAG: ribulokinase [Ferruginibacter sp.]|nr:ribulokinase [Ferruginibacter sp.]
MEKYVIGIDFGSDSVRSVLVSSINGKEVASSVFYYPRWKDGKYCDAPKNQFRQHPLDYLEGLEYTIKNCITTAGQDIAANVKGISIDTTGSTPIAVNAQGKPLAMLPQFEHNPNAMFILWKDHTAIKEAEEINIHATKFTPNYLKYVGGIYSSEWFWAKLLHIIREDEQVKNNLVSFVEHCDWIPFVLTGGNDVTQLKRGVCSAGHKALWAEEFGGLPPNDFFKQLDPLLDGITDNLFTKTYTADASAGTISNEWAKKLGLPNDVVIGVGAFDCHMGAVGGQIEPYYLSKVMGTATCDIVVAPIDEVKDTLVKGICGQVDGSVIPGMIGLEAGQSAFGDTYAWFKNLIAWPITQFIEDENEREKISQKIISALATEAAKIELDDNDELAVDWMNGRRTPDANQALKGAICNINLGSNAPRIFKSLVEATCFGSKAIIERFIAEGITIKGIIALGGVAKKSNYVMQTMSTILNMPIKVHSSEQTCANGAAMFAATAAGIYTKVEDAMSAMGQGFEKQYEPEKEKIAYYEKRYQLYKNLGKKIEN